MDFIPECRGQLANMELENKPRGIVFVHVTRHLPSSGIRVMCITLLSYVGMRVLDWS